MYNKYNFHQYPQLVYNADKTGLLSVPSKSKKIVGRRGGRCVQRIQSGERGILTTLLPCANAVGEFIPPFLIFKGPVILSVDDLPEDTRLKCTSSCYIDTDIFKSFIEHFQRFRV